MAEAGIPVPETEEDWDRAVKALKGVWASKFNDRAYYAMRKAGIPFMDIRMAVLVMPVIRAEYAFVIHTTNPITNDQVCTSLFPSSFCFRASGCVFLGAPVNPSAESPCLNVLCRMRFTASLSVDWEKCLSAANSLAGQWRSGAICPRDVVPCLCGQYFISLTSCAVFGCSARKGDLENPKLLAYPSKSQQMVLTSLSLIFRSDSNGEDLASFAGAGLFDSITAQECEVMPALLL